jgi:hypothetical protein
MEPAIQGNGPLEVMQVSSSIVKAALHIGIDLGTGNRNLVFDLVAGYRYQTLGLRRYAP